MEESATTDNFDPAEMKDRMERIIENAPHVDPAFTNVRRRAYDLWNHPGSFEDGALTDAFQDMGTVEIAFELGVLFGIEYEYAYPTGRRDLWPVPIEERPSPSDAGGDSA